MSTNCPDTFSLMCRALYRHKEERRLPFSPAGKLADDIFSPALFCVSLFSLVHFGSGATFRRLTALTPIRYSCARTAGLFCACSRDDLPGHVRGRRWRRGGRGWSRHAGSAPGVCLKFLTSADCSARQSEGCDAVIDRAPPPSNRVPDTRRGRGT